MPLYFKSQPHTPNHMEDTLWVEIADAPGEIWDLNIPELNEDQEFNFDSYLNGNYDY